MVNEFYLTETFHMPFYKYWVHSQKSAVHSIIPTAGKVQLSFPRHIDCVSPEHQYWNSFHGSISRKSIDKAIRTNRITQINLGS